MVTASVSSTDAAARLPLRAVIADCLEHIIYGGGSLDRELEQSRVQLGDSREHGFLQECVYGTLRQLFSLRALLGELLQRPLRKKDAIVECLLLSGLYQMRSMASPVHAVVNETVAACDTLQRDWARGLVNAVLRNAQRKVAQLDAFEFTSEEARFNHPQWLIGKIRKAWPDHWTQILEANNLHPPMSLRINRLRATREDYAARLLAAGLPSIAPGTAPDALVLERPVRVSELPGFSDGEVSVQDLAAQIAAPLLAVEPGQRVLDACAAPGGKAMHLLELAAGKCDLLAMDINTERLQSVGESAVRLGLPCPLITGDGRQPAEWWDGRPFDRILLDAPCSGTGVIRRHPDIRLHRQPEDLPALVATQRALLEGLWTTLAPGGQLLYVTCSILPVENEELLAAFCLAHGDCAVLPIDAPWGRPTPHGRQILTGEGQMDGFFFGRLQKRTDA